jgi:gamma-glutamyl hercynylcysteine S-oxide synthase
VVTALGRPRLNVVTKPEIVASLAEARRRTLGLLDPIAEPAQRTQVSELMSPLCWDLAHIGHYEELWLVRELTGAPATVELYDDVYDAFKHPRRDRPSLPILDPAAARGFDADVRRRALDVLVCTSLDIDDPLRADGFVYGMVVQHEHQHDETLLATIQLMDDYAHPDADGAGPAAIDTGAPPFAGEVLIPAGTFTMGTDTAPWAYDNERPAHDVTVGAFRIDTTPVTNHAYLAFVEDGGYDDPAHWTGAGWQWRTEAGLEAPQFWRRNDDGEWARRRFGRDESLPLAEPVQHVCWYEADAYARWSGARLPTEREWEYAAIGASAATANLWREDGHRWGPAPVGSRSGNLSRWGVDGMLGDVWEWTASDFEPYPGFRAFPYREYSEVFFGPDYKVLRGGSWATHPDAVRTTFRNWDLPIRRQIFAGFRCARDA